MDKSLHSFQQPLERLVFMFPVVVVCDAFLLQWAVQCLTRDFTYVSLLLPVLKVALEPLAEGLAALLL